MKKKALLLFALCLATVVPAALCAADDLRSESSLVCNGNIVQAGDTKFAVLEKCGQPTMKDEPNGLWVYNFGPGSFVYYLTFLEGQLVQIQSGGYGK